MGSGDSGRGRSATRCEGELIQVKLPLLNPDFTVGMFFQHTKMFHDEFAVFASPAIAPFTTFLVA